MIETSTRCIVCRKRVQLEDIDSRWVASCECTDYSMVAPIGIGATPEDALAEWSASAATYPMPLQPSALASFIVPPPPEGWRLTPFEGAIPRDPPVSLSEAEANWTSPRLAIHYGPSEGQKAANQ
jgi:hypothetical protein